MEMGEVPEPKIEKDNDVLLKITMVGVCGSDVHYYEAGRIGSQVVQYPFIVGHECAATVADVGRAVKTVKVGDRVAVEPAIACHDCDQCRQGRENTCRNLKFLACPGQVSGCLCQYIVMPDDCCFPISDSFSFSQAVLCEPLAISLYAVRQSAFEAGSDVAILGAGPIGLGCLLAAKQKKAGALYMTEKIRERIDVAANAGATWVGNPDKQDIVKEILRQKDAGVDVAFECAGQQETIDQAIEILKPGGKLMLIGIPREDRISFSIDQIRRKEIAIVNVRRQNRCTQECIDLIDSGAIDADFMATHKFKPEDAQEAFEMVSNYRSGVVKALVDFQEL